MEDVNFSSRQKMKSVILFTWVRLPSPSASRAWKSSSAFFIASSLNINHNNHMMTEILLGKHESRIKSGLLYLSLQCIDTVARMRPKVSKLKKKIQTNNVARTMTNVLKRQNVRLIASLTTRIFVALWARHN